MIIILLFLLVYRNAHNMENVHSEGKSDKKKLSEKYYFFP